MTIQSFTFEPELVAAFVELPFRIYENDPLWIPTSRAYTHAQLTEKNPFFAHGTHRAFLARDAAGIVIGRVLATIDRRLVVNGEQVGHVGFFEVAEDESAARALLEAAVSWLRAEGATRIWGPTDFSIFYRYRFKTKGLELAPFAGEPHNPSYYPAFFERFGFVPLERSASWDLAPEHVERILELVAAKKAQKNALALGYTYRPFDVTRWDEELHSFYALTVDAFTEHTGFVPVGFEEFSFFNAGVRLTLDPRTVYFANAKDGTVASSAYCYPDVADLLRSTGGEPTPEQARAYAASGASTTLVLHTAMVHKAHREFGILPAGFPLMWNGGLEAGMKRAIGGFAKIGIGSIFEKLYSVAPRTREYALYELAR